MTLEDRLKNLIEPVCAQRNIFLVEMKVKGAVRKPVIQVFADTEEGITLGECENLTRDIMERLDMELTDIVNYRLDVSSPGIHRPLEHDFEFQRNVGRELAVRLKTEDGEKEINGVLKKYEHNMLTLDIAGKSTEISRDTVIQAKVKTKW